MNLDRLDVAQLRYFHAIARFGSITGASRVLRISQPALTVALRKLEEMFGTVLFHRDRNGVRLTPSGTELLERSNEILVLLEQAAQRISGLQTEDMGHFVLGCP